MNLQRKSSFSSNHEASQMPEAFPSLKVFKIEHDRILTMHYKLGTGVLGDVWVADLDIPGNLVTMKRLRIDQDPIHIQTRVARGLEQWAGLNHGNVLKLEGIWIDPAEAQEAMLVTKYLKNGNIRVYLQSRNLDNMGRLELVTETVRGLLYLHSQTPPICHGNIKPDNVLITDEGHAVWCDFGLASALEDSQTGLTTTKSIGFRYFSPELLDENAKPSLESDVWGWSCLAFEILTKKIPHYTAQNNTAVVKRIIQHQLPGDVDSVESISIMKPLYVRCWMAMPSERPPIFMCMEWVSAICHTCVQSGSMAAGSTKICGTHCALKTNIRKLIFNQDTPPVTSLAVTQATIPITPSDGPITLQRSTAVRAEEARKSSGAGFFSTLGNMLLGPIDEPTYGGDRSSGARRSSKSEQSGSYVRSSKAQRDSELDGDELCEECHVRPKNRVKDPVSGKTIMYPHCGVNCRNKAAQKNTRRCIMCGRESRDDFCSDEHAKKAVVKGKVPGCAFCKVYPANPPYEYCTKVCGMRDAAKREQEIKPLDELDPMGDVFRAIDTRFRDRWRFAKLTVPEIERIYRITLPKKYETRFKEVINKADALGGSITKSAFFGGQCVCDLGFKEPVLCTWKSCTLCVVIRQGFDKLEHGNIEHEGKYGKGIYAHTNPAMAHRWTVRKSNNPFRVVILCSIVELDSHARGDRKKNGAFTDETGKVYCSSKHFIIPRQLIVYSEPSPLGA